MFKPFTAAGPFNSQRIALLLTFPMKQRDIILTSVKAYYRPVYGPWAFLLVSAVKAPLQWPDSGPYKVLECTDKVFKLPNGLTTTVTAYCVQPAYSDDAFLADIPKPHTTIATFHSGWKVRPPLQFTASSRPCESGIPNQFGLQQGQIIWHWAPLPATVPWRHDTTPWWHCPPLYTNEDLDWHTSTVAKKCYLVPAIDPFVSLPCITILGKAVEVADPPNKWVVPYVLERFKNTVKWC